MTDVNETQLTPEKAARFLNEDTAWPTGWSVKAAAWQKGQSMPEKKAPSNAYERAAVAQSWLRSLRAELNNAEEALAGDSWDEEHDALRGLADAVSGFLKEMGAP
jgi:hypothetical protein